MGPAFARGESSTPHPPPKCGGVGPTPLLGCCLHTPVCAGASATPGCQWQESVCNTLLSLPLFFALRRIPNTFLQRLKISTCNSKVETEAVRKSRHQ